MTGYNYLVAIRYLFHNFYDKVIYLRIDVNEKHICFKVIARKLPGERTILLANVVMSIPYFRPVYFFLHYIVALFMLRNMYPIS